MQNIEKYDNLKDIMPKLQPVLVEAIQSEFLEIKKLTKNARNTLHPAIKCLN
jgi:hypothetical protein